MVYGQCQMYNINHWIILARQLATGAHIGQTRRGGEPYIKHPERIANRVNDRLKPIAWLHDVPEDTDITISDLESVGFPKYIIDAVNLLTHKKTDTNEMYWKKILQNEDAITIKLEDIRDNLAGTPSDYARQKYARALALFKQYGYSMSELKQE
jgi:(p)ppGpp synthase/HD superfamily hydrolase